MMSPACQLGPHALQWSWRGRAQALGCAHAGNTQLDGRAISRGSQVGCPKKRAFTWFTVRKSCNKSFKLFESICIVMWASSREKHSWQNFFHQSKGQRQKNGLESKFGTSSSRNPISDVSIRVVDESPHLLVGQTCTTWSVGFYCWPCQAAVLGT